MTECERAAPEEASDQCCPDRPLDKHGYFDMATAHLPEKPSSPNWPDSPQHLHSRRPAHHQPPTPRDQQPHQQLQQQQQSYQETHQQPPQYPHLHNRRPLHQQPHQPRDQKSHQEPQQHPHQQPQQQQQQQQQPQQHSHQQPQQQQHQQPQQHPHQLPQQQQHQQPQQHPHQVPQQQQHQQPQQQQQPLQQQQQQQHQQPQQQQHQQPQQQQRQQQYQQQQQQPQQQQHQQPDPHHIPQQHLHQQPQQHLHQKPQQQKHQQSYQDTHQQPPQYPHVHIQRPLHQPTDQHPHQQLHQQPRQQPHQTPHQQAHQAPLRKLHQPPPEPRSPRHRCDCYQRQPVTIQGKSVNSKDALEEKKDDSDLWETQAAFLGPNLWDKTLPYDPDLKVQEYVDLDEFLSENGMQGEGLGGAHLGGGAAFPPLGLQAPLTKRERSPSPSECCSPDTLNPPLSPADSTFSMASSGRDFDPRTRAFSDEELKPQPMIKKSRKQFVPDDLKDDKYWARRRKNNMAAKRSRDARRMKENQIALRAGYLEKENMGLRQEVELLKKENHILREKLSKFADV